VLGAGSSFTPNPGSIPGRSDLRESRRGGEKSEHGATSRAAAHRSVTQQESLTRIRFIPGKYCVAGSNPADSHQLLQEGKMIKIDASLFGKVAKFAAGSDIRSYLEGVRIEPHHERGAVVVATNGHILAAMHDPDGVCDEPMTMRCTEDFLFACKTGKRDDDAARRMVVVESGVAKVVFADQARTAIKDGDIYILPKTPALEGQYPNWRKILSGGKDMQKGMSACINAFYLRKFTAVAGKGFDTIEFWQSGEGDRSLNPVYVQLASTPEFIGVIMPLTSNNVTLPPAWLQRQEAEAQP